MSVHAYTTQARRPRAHRALLAPGSGAAGPLWLAGGCVLAMALVWGVAEHVAAVRVKDAVALYHLTLLNGPAVESIGNFLLHLLSPGLFILWGAALVAIAVARARPRVGAAVAAVMALAPLSSELLKPVLAHHHDSVGGVYIGPASWPSGHATAALALVLCAVLVAPSRLRPLVAALGALYALAVGLALLILVWHMPSDVLGGYLMATMWAALALAGLRFAERRRPPARAAAA